MQCNYLIGPVSLSEFDILVNASRSQKLTVLSWDEEARRNS